MKKATIKDVAHEARVSTALVSRVLNAPLRADGSPDCVVNPHTAKRIFEAVQNLGYHPNKAAVSLRKTMKKRLGWILPDLSKPFYAGIARYFGEIAHKNGYIVMFGSSDENANKLYELAEAFIQEGIDGLILTPGANCEDVVAKIVSKGVPVVLTIRDIPGIDGVGRVMTDDAAATKLAVGHLLAQGFRRIEMVSTTVRFSNVILREQLFKEEMSRNGLSTRIHHCDNNNISESLELILEDVLRRGVEALYFPSMHLPLEFLQVCKEQGVSIPSRIALMGYDGGKYYKACSPSLTQIAFSQQDIAENAFSTLISMGTTPSDTPCIRYMTPTLYAAESTLRSKPGDETPDRLQNLSAAASTLREAVDALQAEIESVVRGL